VTLLPARKTKTHECRFILMSSDLRAVVKMRRVDSKENPFPSDDYVFGDAVGEPLVTIKATWQTACRRAVIDVFHFHDLRLDFLCRLMESSANLQDVRGGRGTPTSR